MQRSSSNVFFGFVVLAAAAAATPSQARPMWRTEIGAGVVAFVERGQEPLFSLLVGGYPHQVRADLEGRAVVKDAIVPVIHLVSPLGTFISVGLPGSCADAVPDGNGGAFVLVNVSTALSLFHCDPTGQLLFLFSREGTGVKLRLLSDGTVLIAGVAGGVHAVFRAEIGTGQVVAAIFDARGPSDLTFDDSGNLLLPGLELATVPVYSRSLVRLRSFRGVYPVTGAHALRGGGAVIISGWPPRVDIVDAASRSLTAPFTTPGAGSHSGLPDGSVMVCDVANSAAIVADPGGAFTWYGAWPVSYGNDDGAGMDFARSFALELDPDQDGFLTAVELREGTDPGSAESRPARLVFDGTFLDLAAPGHPSATYVVAAASTVPPGTLLPFPWADALFLASLEPGVVFGVPFGILDNQGANRIQILPPRPYPAGLVVGAVIFSSGSTVPSLLVPAVPVPVTP